MVAKISDLAVRNRIVKEFLDDWPEIGRGMNRGQGRARAYRVPGPLGPARIGRTQRKCCRAISKILEAMSGARLNKHLPLPAGV